MLLNLLTLLFVSGSVLAQTQAEIQACSNSLIMTSYPESEVYTFSTTDSSFFEATYSYNPETCTPNIPINRLVLNDLSQFRVFACSLQQFDGSGVITSVCNLPGSPVTRGRMAIDSARDGSLDWSFTFNLGVRPTLVNIENQFGVIGEGPIPTGDIAQRKRSWRHALRNDFDCPIGKSMCPTGFKGRFECINVSSDIMSCGSCPGALKVNDCTSIEGAASVDCRQGSCYVSACEKGWTVNSRNTECIPNIVRASPTW